MSLGGPASRRSLWLSAAAVIALLCVTAGTPATRAAAEHGGLTAKVQATLHIEDPVVLYASDTYLKPKWVPVRAEAVSDHAIYDGSCYYQPVSMQESDWPEFCEWWELREGTGFKGKWAGEAKFYKHTKPGRYELTFSQEVAVGEEDDEQEYTQYTTRTFYVKRNTMMPSFNAAPEPVRRGTSVKVSGRLTRLNPSVGYVGYGGKTVNMYFKPVGGTWTMKGSATTDSHGSWSRSFTASEDGSWQARFKGTSNYHRETSHSDYVDVQ